jgi:hypothetical protein
VIVHLGQASRSGDAGSDECSRFKQELRRRIGSVDGASLVSVSNRREYGVVVRYDVGNAEAETWAVRAKEEADAVWEVVKRSRERVRV